MKFCMLRNVSVLWRLENKLLGNAIFSLVVVRSDPSSCLKFTLIRDSELLTTTKGKIVVTQEFVFQTPEYRYVAEHANFH